MQDIFSCKRENALKSMEILTLWTLIWHVNVILLLAARAQTHTEPPNVTGAKTERGPTGTRTQGLPLTVRALYH